MNAAYGLAEGETLEGTYTLEGVIASIDDGFNPQYNNITVTIIVGDMSDKPIKCYRMKGEGADTLKKGDTITVTGTLKNYYGAIEFDTGCTLDAVVPGPEVEPEDPTIPGMTDATIDFSDYTYRTEEGTNFQTFVNGDFVFTQAQGSSNSWNTTYIAPIRLYAGHEVTIAYPGMTKIVIDGNSGKPLTGWTDSITDSNATVTIDGLTVTIEFATPVDSFTVAFASQVRVNAITVYAPAAETPDEPAANEIKVTTTDTYGWFDEYTFVADAAGNYTFTLPAGLGMWSVEAYSTWAEPELDYNMITEGGDVTVEFTAPEEPETPDPENPDVPSGEPDGTMDNPYVITELPTVLKFDGEHDVYYSYTSATLTKLEITYTDGCAVSFYSDNPPEWDKDEGAMKYILLVYEGQTVIINPWASVDGAYEITGGGKK